MFSLELIVLAKTLNLERDGSFLCDALMLKKTFSLNCFELFLQFFVKHSNIMSDLIKEQFTIHAYLRTCCVCKNTYSNLQVSMKKKQRQRKIKDMTTTVFSETWQNGKCFLEKKSFRKRKICADV